jgi:hypothetical protein
MFASVLISDDGAVAPLGSAGPGAAPVLKLTRLFTVAAALIIPVVLPGGDPIFAEVDVLMNCDIAYADAAVVTSLIVMEPGVAI